MHPFDHLENFTDDWISHLQGSLIRLVLSIRDLVVPLQRKAKDENRLKFRKVYDYFSAYDFWEVVSEECDKFDGSHDVVIVASHSNANHITPESMGGGVDALNTFLNCKGKDYGYLRRLIIFSRLLWFKKLAR